MKTVKKSPESASTRMEAVGLGARQPRLPLFVKPVVALIIAGHLNGPALLAIEFEGHGDITISYQNAGEKDEQLRRSSFIVIVKQNLWNIRTIPSGISTNSANELVAYYESGTDGTNCYWFAPFNPVYDAVAGARRFLDILSSLESGLQRKSDTTSLLRIQKTKRLVERQVQVNARTNRVKNTAVGVIDPIAFPRFSQTDLIAPVWLAFCSGAYFGQDTSQAVPRVFQEIEIGQPIQSNLFCRASWTMSAAQPLLPQSINFEDGKAVYGAAVFRNYDGIILPSEFRLSRRLPGSGNESRTVFSIFGELRRVRPSVTGSVFVPDISGVVRVQDNRFHFDPTVQRSMGYFAESNQWLQVHELKRSNQYKHAVLNHARAVRSVDRKRFIVYCALVVLALAGVYAIMKSKDKQLRDNNNNAKGNQL